MKRICPKCKIEKELIKENFYRNKSEVNGFQYVCKLCHKKYYKRKFDPKHYNPQYNLEYKNKKYKEDLEFRLLTQLRNRVNQYLRKGNKEKTIDFLGCNINEWKLHLEQQFKPGMNWDNHGVFWEIDHIKPLSKGGSFHFSNTQPLTLIENRTKSNS